MLLKNLPATPSGKTRQLPGLNRYLKKLTRDLSPSEKYVIKIPQLYKLENGLYSADIRLNKCLPHFIFISHGIASINRDYGFTTRYPAFVEMGTEKIHVETADTDAVILVVGFPEPNSKALSFMPVRANSLSIDGEGGTVFVSVGATILYAEGQMSVELVRSLNPTKKMDATNGLCAFIDPMFPVTYVDAIGKGILFEVVFDIPDKTTEAQSP